MNLRMVDLDRVVVVALGVVLVWGEQPAELVLRAILRARQDSCSRASLVALEYHWGFTIDRSWFESDV